MILILSGRSRLDCHFERRPRRVRLPQNIRSRRRRAAMAPRRSAARLRPRTRACPFWRGRSPGPAPPLPCASRLPARGVLPNIAGAGLFRPLPRPPPLRFLPPPAKRRFAGYPFFLPFVKLFFLFFEKNFAAGNLRPGGSNGAFL
jgi:hypothetical protein